MTDIAFADAGLTLFEDRLIYKAQPPAGDAEIARIEALLAGPVPPDLVALWRLCYGGHLHYDLDIHFGAHIHPFSFGELFFPGSRGYHDLDGWIAHERDLLAENAAQKGHTGGDLKLEFLPFGGFEYRDRLYVRAGKDDYGAVYAYSRGLPPAWHLRLHEESFTRVADNVRALFGMLYLALDPLTTSPDDFPAGLEALEAIDLARDSCKLDRSDADRLQAILAGAFADWRSALERGTLSADPRLARLALEHAAEAGDLALLQRLERAGIDVARPLRGGGTVLDHALDHGHIGLANALLDRGLKGGPQTFQCVPEEAEPELLHRLYRAGATPNPYAVVEAVRSVARGLRCKRRSTRARPHGVRRAGADAVVPARRDGDRSAVQRRRHAGMQARRDAALGAHA
jgi:SMI1/KNR4 family protein SUKH-1